MNSGIDGMVGGVEEDDLRQSPADAFFSGSLLFSFWCSWRLLCVFFDLGPFTKVVPFKVLEAVASGTVGGTVGDDRTEVLKASTTCCSVFHFLEFACFPPIIINVHHFLPCLYKS